MPLLSFLNKVIFCPVLKGHAEHADQSLNTVAGSDGGISSSTSQTGMLANRNLTGSSGLHQGVSLIGC